MLSTKRVLVFDRSYRLLTSATSCPLFLSTVHSKQRENEQLAAKKRPFTLDDYTRMTSKNEVLNGI